MAGARDYTDFDTGEGELGASAGYIDGGDRGYDGEGASAPFYANAHSGETMYYAGPAVLATPGSTPNPAAARIAEEDERDDDEGGASDYKGAEVEATGNGRPSVGDDSTWGRAAEGDAEESGTAHHATQASMESAPTPAVARPRVQVSVASTTPGSTPMADTPAFGHVLDQPQRQGATGGGLKWPGSAPSDDADATAAAARAAAGPASNVSALPAGADSASGTDTDARQQRHGSGAGARSRGGARRGIGAASGRGRDRPPRYQPPFSDLSGSEAPPPATSGSEGLGGFVSDSGKGGFYDSRRTRGAGPAYDVTYGGDVGYGDSGDEVGGSLTDVERGGQSGSAGSARARSASETTHEPRQSATRSDAGEALVYSEAEAEASADAAREAQAERQATLSPAALEQQRRLVRAAQEGDLDTLTEQLRHGRVDINCVDDDGATPLHNACVFGRVLAVKMLLSCGAQVHTRNNGGGTPLHAAATGGNQRIVEDLVLAGAHVNARTAMGQTARTLADRMGHAAVAEYLRMAERADRMIRVRVAEAHAERDRARASDADGRGRLRAATNILEAAAASGHPDPEARHRAARALVHEASVNVCENSTADDTIDMLLARTCPLVEPLPQFATTAEGEEAAPPPAAKYGVAPEPGDDDDAGGVAGSAASPSPTKGEAGAVSGRSPAARGPLTATEIDDDPKRWLPPQKQWRRRDPSPEEWQELESNRHFTILGRKAGDREASREEQMGRIMPEYVRPSTIAYRCVVHGLGGANEQRVWLLKALMPFHLRGESTSTSQEYRKLARLFENDHRVAQLLQRAANPRHPNLAAVIHTFRGSSMLVKPFVTSVFLEMGRLRHQVSIANVTTYAVSEYLPRSLRDVFADAETSEAYAPFGIDIDRILVWLLQCCYALRHMNTECGVCHTHIRPNTIFVDETSDRVIIGEFGWALTCRDPKGEPIPFRDRYELVAREGADPWKPVEIHAALKYGPAGPPEYNDMVQYDAAAEREKARLVALAKKAGVMVDEFGQPLPSVAGESTADSEGAAALAAASASAAASGSRGGGGDGGRGGPLSSSSAPGSELGYGDPPSASGGGYGAAVLEGDEDVGEPFTPASEASTSSRRPLLDNASRLRRRGGRIGGAASAATRSPATPGAGGGDTWEKLYKFSDAEKPRALNPRAMSFRTKKGSSMMMSMSSPGQGSAEGGGGSAGVAAARAASPVGGGKGAAHGYTSDARSVTFSDAEYVSDVGGRVKPSQIHALGAGGSSSPAQSGSGSGSAAHDSSGGGGGGGGGAGVGGPGGVGPPQSQSRSLFSVGSLKSKRTAGSMAAMRQKTMRWFQPVAFAKDWYEAHGRRGLGSVFDAGTPAAVGKQGAVADLAIVALPGAGVAGSRASSHGNLRGRGLGPTASTTPVVGPRPSRRGRMNPVVPVKLHEMVVSLQETDGDDAEGDLDGADALDRDGADKYLNKREKRRRRAMTVRKSEWEREVVEREDGRYEFYFNIKSGMSMWRRPLEYESPPESTDSEAEADGGHGSGGGGGGGDDEVESVVTVGDDLRELEDKPAASLGALFGARGTSASGVQGAPPLTRTPSFTGTKAPGVVRAESYRSLTAASTPSPATTPATLGYAPSPSPSMSPGVRPVFPGSPSPGIAAATPGTLEVVPETDVASVSDSYRDAATDGAAVGSGAGASESDSRLGPGGSRSLGYGLASMLSAAEAAEAAIPPPPEITLEHVTSKWDTFALGRTFFCLLRPRIRPPAAAKDQRPQWAKMPDTQVEYGARAIPVLPEVYPLALQGVLRAMVRADPTRRVDAADASDMLEMMIWGPFEEDPLFRGRTAVDAHMMTEWLRRERTGAAFGVHQLDSPHYFGPDERDDGTYDTPRRRHFLAMRHRYLMNATVPRLMRTFRMVRSAEAEAEVALSREEEREAGKLASVSKIHTASLEGGSSLMEA